MLNIFLLNVLHHVPAMQEVGFQVMRQPQRNGHKLVVRHLIQRNFAARRNHVRAPLKNESYVPNCQHGNESTGQNLRPRHFSDPGGTGLNSAASPRIKIGVREMKKRFPKLEMPSQSG